MQILIIAEKPSVARSIASVVKANESHKGYYSGNGYYVSYAFGHLYRLANAVEYDPKFEKWNLENFPFIPDKFRYIPIENDGILKQIDTIDTLAKKSDLIINALDGDREGELIFAELKNNLKFDKPIKRLWLSSHTPKDVEKGMNELLKSLDNLEASAYCRQQIDWILGINFTVLFSLVTGGNYTLNVGRVMLPTLKLIYDRSLSVKKFISKDYHTLKATFEHDKGIYSGTYINNNGESKYDDQIILEKIKAECLNQHGAIENYSSKLEKESASRLFSLTDLQGYITDKYTSFTGDKVLTALQSLYEKKYVTYPRTASRYLNQSQLEESHDSIKAILNKKLFNIDETLIDYHSKSTVFDDKKVDSHPALMPTYIIPDFNHLINDEKIIYQEISKRFLSLFLPDAEYEVIEFISNINNHHFKSKSRVLTKEGWRVLYPKNAEKEEDNEDTAVFLKDLSDNDRMMVKDLSINKGKTKPSPYYTEKTILQAMENCGKDVADEEEILKGFTIGTPVTRADTIKKLLKIGYIDKVKKNLVITDLGIKVIELFPIKQMLSVSFTGKIEKTLKDIEIGNYDPRKFMNIMSEFAKKNAEEMKDKPQTIIERQTDPKVIIGKCPECGKNVYENQKAYSCEDTIHKKCSFTIWKDNALLKKYGKKMTSSIAKKLINDNKAPIKGLKSPKSGKNFDTILLLQKNNETGYWGFTFDFNS